MIARSIYLALVAAACLGCASPGWHFGRKCVQTELSERADYDLGPVTCVGETSIPGDVDAGDGLTEDEAVRVALWNNTAFQQLLADMGLARADVIQARQLTNPELWSVFPVGVKQLEFAFNVPLDAFWLRPKRVAAAELESRRIGQRLVQDGLNVVRDVRVAYADLILAEDRLRLNRRGARLRTQIATLGQARLDAGDATQLEVASLKLDGLLGEEEARRSEHDCDLARQRLLQLMGLQFSASHLGICQAAVLPSPLPAVGCDVEDLVCEATQSRSDLLALEAARDAAVERARLARVDYLRVWGVLPDANGRGLKGFEAGPGLQFTVPIFHQNQGAIARAEAEVDRTERQWAALRDTIGLEVRQAYTRFVQAKEDLAAWRQRIVPLATESVTTADRAYRSGGVPALLVLEASRQLLAAEQRVVQTEADLRRAAAELDRSVGRHVTMPGPEELSLPTESREPPIEELPF